MLAHLAVGWELEGAQFGVLPTRLVALLDHERRRLDHLWMHIAHESLSRSSGFGQSIKLLKVNTFSRLGSSILLVLLLTKVIYPFHCCFVWAIMTNR